MGELTRLESLRECVDMTTRVVDIAEGMQLHTDADRLRLVRGNFQAEIMKMLMEPVFIPDARRETGIG